MQTYATPDRVRTSQETTVTTSEHLCARADTVPPPALPIDADVQTCVQAHGALVWLARRVQWERRLAELEAMVSDQGGRA